jgi:hypothetical protein
MINRSMLDAALTPVLRSVGAMGTSLSGNGGTQPEAQIYTFYEAYLYSLVLRALQTAGMSPIAQPYGSKFRFRRAPGEIYTKPYMFSYVTFSAKRKYELHGDTKIASKFAETPLEVDVVVITGAQATRCRNGKCRPSYRTVRLIIESKFYSGGIGLTEAKSYMAICVGVRVARCVDSLVSNGKISKDARQLLRGYRPPLTTSSNISPLARDSSNVSDFLQEMDHRLTQIL